jgi:hypothetical protein
VADNVRASAGTNDGATFATDDDGTAHHPYVKVEWGSDNTFTKVSTGSSALPVQGAGASGSAVAGNPVLAAGSDGTNARNLSTNVSGHVNIADGGNSITVDNGGTFAVQAVAAGDVAHDGADSGNPVKVGAKATTGLTGATMVANSDRVDNIARVDGALIVQPFCPLEDVVQERTTNTDGASTAFASGLAAPGAGVRLWVTSVDICNSSATFCTVDLRDGSAGSVLWTLPVPATGGVVKQFNRRRRLSARAHQRDQRPAGITRTTPAGSIEFAAEAAGAGRVPVRAAGVVRITGPHKGFFFVRPTRKSHDNGVEARNTGV